MNILTKGIILLVLSLGLFMGGFYAGKGQKETETITKTIKGEDTIKTVEKIVTVIKTIKPDGTVIEERRNENISIREKLVYVDKEKLIYTKPILSNYSVGIMATKSYKEFSLTDLQPNFSITAGYRAIGEFWLDTSFTPSTGTISLGLSFKF